MSPLLAIRLIAALERAAGSPEVPTPALLKKIQALPHVKEARSLVF